jgi:hypothetical protein
MFRLQATAKRIDFTFERPNPLPETVYADEKRLRQIRKRGRFPGRGRQAVWSFDLELA